MDEIITDLTKMVSKSQTTDERSKESWISKISWDLMTNKATERRKGNVEKEKSLKKMVQKSLHKDRQERIKKASIKVESFIRENRIREAFATLKSWY